MSEKGDFKYKVCGLDRIVDERGSAFIALRKLVWGVSQGDLHDPEKEVLDIRKYYSTQEGERLSKGVSFLTPDGPNELVKILLEEGYGDTGECLKVLKDRSDFVRGIYYAYGEESSEDVDDEFIDPRALLDKYAIAE